MRKILSLLTAILFAGSLMATSVSKTVEALASANEWENSTVVTPFALDEVITVSTTATDANTGKYYTAGNQIRLYQTGAASITLSAADGYAISSVKLTYASQNTGILLEAASGTAVPFENVQSATFTVGNSGTATNGQVRLTAFEVEYAATGGTTPVTPATTKTIYCKCAQSWWKEANAAVAIHYWGGASAGTTWPGVRMAPVTGETDMWSYDVPTDVEGLMFVRVNGTGDVADWGAKTANLTLPTDDKNLYTITSTSAVWGDPGVAGAWSVYGGEVTPVDPPTPVDSMTVFFVNVPEWTAVNAFVWPAEGDAYKAWPGEAMTPVNTEINGKAVYAYTFPENYVNIIFNNGVTQTADLVWNAAKPYFYDGAWYELDSIPAPTPVVPVDSMTVFFVNVPEWTAVNAFVWPAEGDAYKAWPGEAMTPVDMEINEKAVYAYTFPASNVNIIFNNGVTQTADLVWNAAKPYFYDGAWYELDSIPAPTPVVPVDSMTVFFVNVPEWTAVNAFVWPAEGDAYKAWPGEAMTPVNTEINGKAVYAYTFPENYVNIIFNNGVTQTADLVWNAAKPYFYDGAWYELDSIPAPTPVVPVDSMTVFFVNVPEWTAVNAFVWPAEGDAYKAWPGEAMTPVNTEINGKAVYAYTFPENYVNIIFNNGEAQTADLVWDATKPYFYDGAWYELDSIPAPTPVVPVDSMTVYFVNVPEWETVNAFVWPAEGDAYKVWPGEAMTPVNTEINGKAVYAYTFPENYVNIIFNNGEAQTADLVWNAAKPYFYDGAWYELDSIPTEPIVHETMTVYFVNVPEWETVNAFVWPAEGNAPVAWPGEAMTPVDMEINGKAVFAYTFDAINVNIIFNNGEAQTADLVWNAAKPYFYDGAWYELDSIPTEPIVHETMTVYFVNVPEWETVNAFVWPAEGNAPVAWPGEAMTPVDMEINGKAVFAYTFDAINVNIIFNNGDAQTADLVWNAAKPYFYDGAWYELDSIPTEPIVHETMTVYFVNVPEWETVNAFVWPAEGNAPVAWPGEAMTPVDMEINGKAVFAYTFDAINVNIIFNNGEAQTADLVWNAAKPYFYDGAWYELDSIPTEPIVHETMTVYFVNVPEWETVNAFVWPAEGNAPVAWPGEAMTPVDMEINGKAVFAYTFDAINVNIIFNNGEAQTADLVWNAAKPYFYDGAWYALDEIPTPGPTIENGFYLVGTMNDWTPAAEYKFVANEGAEGEYQLSATLDEGDELKVVKYTEGEQLVWYPAEGDNYVVDAAHAGLKTIYFRPNYDGGDDWFASCIYIAGQGEGVENIDADAKTVKQVINGSLFIIRGEKTYTIQGQLVR